MRKAKNFKLIGTSNEIVELNKIKSKFTVLYFYPKDDTPGCTLETKDFNSFYNKFKKLKGNALGLPELLLIKQTSTSPMQMSVSFFAFKTD